MKRSAFDVDGRHLHIGDDNAAGVLASIEFAPYRKAGFGGGRRDQFDDHPIADQWRGAPVLADEREEPVLDFVPLCALLRRLDVVGANPTRQLSLQPEAPGADQEATNGLKHFGKRSLLGISGP